MFEDAPLSWRSKRIVSERKQGNIEVFTKILSAPLGFESKVPYILSLIKLEDGTLQFGEIVDTDNPKIGMKVESCIRKVYSDNANGIIHYGVKFRVIK